MRRLLVNRYAALFILTCLCVLLLSTSLVCAADFCSRKQTEDYLADGTTYAFTQKQLDYVIVIDRSGSMQGEKLDTVKRAAGTLINELGAQDRAAIISFNYDARMDQALTSSKSELRTAVENIEASFSTQYAPALRLSQRQLTNTARDRALIFLSDGKSDFSETPEQIGALTTAIARQDVCIMTISYALEGEESPQLRAMADIGRSAGCGEHYIASERGSELEEVFETIRDRLTATDIIELRPEITGTAYRFSFASRLNNYSLPGSIGTSCVETPEVHLDLYRAGQPYVSYNMTEGTIFAPAGSYTYSARATVRCGGTCSFSGTHEGILSVGDGCNPSYAQLAAYLAGNERIIQITANGFTPQTVTAQQGATIIWNNTDTKPHTIVSSFFNTTIPPKELFAYRVENVGTLLFTDVELGKRSTIEAIAGTGSDVLLVFDESGSMRGKTLEEARLAAQQFFRALAPGDRAGLLTFSQGARVLSDFTSDKETLIEATESLRSGGATSYLTALELAETLRPVQQPIMIFMSDGEPTDPEGIEGITEAVERLRYRGWCIMTVGFGEGGTRARSVLARMAGDDACAAFVYAADGELATAFGTIYQLLYQNNDLTFDNLRLGPIAIGREVTIRTHVSSHAGSIVPGGSVICSPEAKVQASTASAVTTLYYDNDGFYSGNLSVQYGLVRVSVLASVASADAIDKPLVGRETRTILVVPTAVLWSIVSVVILASGAGAVAWRRWRKS